MKSWKRDTMKESRAFKGPYNFLHEQPVLREGRSYSFRVGIYVTVGEELVKNHSKTPNVGFVGESGFIDRFWCVPESDGQWNKYKNSGNRILI